MTSCHLPVEALNFGCQKINTNRNWNECKYTFYVSKLNILEFVKKETILYYYKNVF